VTQDQVHAGNRVIAGRYAVIRELGRGGMGVVWLAEDRMIGRRVAIKELRLLDGADVREKQVLEERVLREARAAGRLNDPGVVTVYDVLREAGGTFIVMELIEAPTLTDLVERDGPLPQASVARIALRVLSALEAAHAAGVVHRDVKPSNIMVSPTGRVKLTDFGIAQASGDGHLTTTGILIGSPIYMAPERMQGAEANAGSDLWSLGAALFFAVEGYDAFERETTAAIIHAVLHEVPYLTRCQGPLAAVITGLLNPQPEARPSAAQARMMLGQVAVGPRPLPGSTPPATTMPGGMPYPPGPVARRRLSMPVFMLVAALLVALFTGGYLVRAATEPKAESGTEAATPPAGMERTLTYGPGGDLEDFSWDTADSKKPCIDAALDAGERITASDQVSCSKPHRLQVFDYLVFWDKPDPDECDCVDIGYPGTEKLTSFTEDLCTMMFDSEVLSDTSGLRYRAVVPTEQQWGDAREVACVLEDAEGDRLTRSHVTVE
jgi:eukaryotic-like serine/threonine-protein kinase